MKAITTEDLVEIYYAVEYKLSHSMAVRGNREWEAHMRSILRKLGPEGSNVEFILMKEGV